MGLLNRFLGLFLVFGHLGFGHERINYQLFNQCTLLKLAFGKSLTPFLLLCPHVRLISDYQGVQLLVRLHPEQLVLFPLCKVKQLLNLLLLLHLSLLLLLLELMLFKSPFLELSLLFFESFEPAHKLAVVLAVRLISDCYCKHCCREETERRLARVCQLRRAHWPRASCAAQVSQLGVSVEVSLFVRCKIARLGKSFEAAWKIANVGFFARVSAEVRAKIKVKTKALVAEGTLEGLLACVNQLVALELRIVQKLFVASLDRTDVLPLAVSHQVLAQRAGVLEKLSTAKHMAGHYLSFYVRTARLRSRVARRRSFV